MGKRKSKRVAPKRAKTSLDTAFNCVFCNHDNSVTVKLDRNMNIGNLSCRACGVSFQSHVNYLSEPIDVYSDWLDACEQTNKMVAQSRAAAGAGARDGRASDDEGRDSDRGRSRGRAVQDDDEDPDEEDY